MNVKNRFFSVIIMGSMAVSMISSASAANLIQLEDYAGTAISATQNVQPFNNKDSAFNFSFWGVNDDEATGWRKKDNATATYINVETLPKDGFRVSVDGATKSDGTGCTDCTRGTAFVSSSGEYFIRQDVNEDGFSYARLRGTKSCIAVEKASGKWSPDSVGSFTYLN